MALVANGGMDPCAIWVDGMQEYFRESTTLFSESQSFNFLQKMKRTISMFGKMKF